MKAVSIVSRGDRVGAARGPHRGVDATAAAHDLLASGAVQPRLEPAGAVAAADEVRVAVDEAGRDQRAAEVDFILDLQTGRQPAQRIDPAQHAAGGQPSTIATSPQPAPYASVAGRALLHSVIMGARLRKRVGGTSSGRISRGAGDRRAATMGSTRLAFSCS